MPFQKEGVAFVINRYGRACICDEMGLGKTLQAIAVACYYERQNRYTFKLFIVCLLLIFPYFIYTY